MNISEQAATYAARAVDAARKGAARAAERVEATEKPVDTLADAARQLNSLSHRYAGRMLDRGVLAVHGLIDGGAARLRRAAQADDIRSLYREQIEQLPASRDRIVRDARATWDIVADAGRELQALALTTYASLVRAPKAPSARARAKKTRRRTRAA